MRIKMRATGRQLVGYDKESGRVVRRKVYVDTKGRQYVRLGMYAATQPDAHVTREWFCDNILREGMIER